MTFPLYRSVILLTFFNLIFLTAMSLYVLYCN